MRENYHVTMEIEGSETKSITSKTTEKAQIFSCRFCLF